MDDVWGRDAGGTQKHGQKGRQHHAPADAEKTGQKTGA